MYKSGFSNIVGISEFGGSTKKAIRFKEGDCADKVHQYLSSLESLSDEDLLKREIKAEENRLLGNFVSTVSTVSLGDAKTLLRLLPVLAGNSRTTTHRIAMLAGGVVRKAHDTTEVEVDKSVYAKILKQAGRVCFRTGMRVGGEIQDRERILFGQFVKDTKEFESYKDCQQRKNKTIPSVAEPVQVACLGSKRSCARYFDDQMGYTNV